MKINIADPILGTQYSIKRDDEFIEHIIGRKIGDTIEGSILGEDFSRNEFLINGGHDKQGFLLKKNLNTFERLKINVKKGSLGNRSHFKRKNLTKKRTVRGGILSSEISSINLVKLPNNVKESSVFPSKEQKLAKRVTKLKTLFKTYSKLKFKTLLFYFLKIKYSNTEITNQEMNLILKCNPILSYFTKKSNYFRFHRKDNFNSIRKFRKLKKSFSNKKALPFNGSNTSNALRNVTNFNK
ncbi:ribosomal protein S6 (nucleomorph) [Bigelowiella natans]|uniref:Ribosomal protein S6 n=1 Tax=Bigelowiella natans TaxID=227086 RepID=Q3LVW0_BIGNA|nr:ribosomal protein S6 [Bigelowiella natans]ABA27405.1 ribosomal protein S6 [Bigelowiella natans]